MFETTITPQFADAGPMGYIKNNVIFIILQSKSLSDLKDMFFYTWPNIMKNNPYLKYFGK